MPQPLMPAAVPLRHLDRTPRGSDDPMLLDLAPGVYAFPVAQPGRVGRVVIVSTPDGVDVGSYAILAERYASAASDVAFEHWRRACEAAHPGERRRLRLVRGERRTA